MVTSFRNLKNTALALNTFLRDFFTSKECPVYWIIALVINISLLLGASDLLKEPYSFSDISDNATLPLTSQFTNSSAGRVIVFVIDDLTPTSFFSSVAKGSALRKVMERTGVWGLAVSQENYSDVVSFRMLLSGSDWRGSPMPLEPEYWYIGEEPMLSYMRGVEMSVKWNGRTHKGDMGSNLTWATIPKDLTDWTYENSLNVFYDISKRKNRNAAKLTILIHFTGVKMAKHLEGERTPLMDETIRETNRAIESLVHASEDLWSDDRTIYLLVSNTKESPFLIWGSGVSGALPAGRSALQPIEWKTPSTKRRDLDRRQIAVLLFCLLGIHPSKDSSGTLPLEVLKDSDKFKAECSMNSAFQLVRLYKDLVARKKAIGSAKLSTLWSPISEKSVDSKTSNIYNLLTNRDYHGVITMSKYLAEKSQQGIEFYVNFNRNLLWFFLLFTNAGWFLCVTTWLCPATNALQPNQENDDQHHDCTCFGLGFIFARRFFFIVLYALFIGLLGAILTFEEVSYQIYFHLTCNAVVWWCFFNGIKKLVSVYNATGAQLVNGDAYEKIVSLLHGILTFIDWLFAGDPIALVILLVISLSFSSLTCLVGSKKTLHSVWLLSSLPLLTSIIEYERLQAALSPFLSAFAWIVVASFFTYLFGVKPIDIPILAATVSTIGSLAWRSRHRGLNEWVYTTPWLVVIFIPFLGSGSFPTRLIQVLLSLSATFFCTIVSTGDQLKFLFFIMHAVAWLIFEEYETTQDFLTEPVKRNRTQNNPPEGQAPLPSQQIQLHDVRRSSFFLLYCFFVVPVRQLTSKISAWQEQYQAELKPSIFLRGLNYLLQVFVPILCLTLLFDHMNRKSNRNQSKTIALTMFFYSFMTLVYLVSAYESSPIQVADSISYFIQPLLICVSFLIALPVSYVLTLPSILSLKK